MERFFSVVVETEDGRTETLRLSGATPGAAFQLAKQTPGVRRVGKVAEVGSSTAPDPARAAPQANRGSHQPQQQHRQAAAPGRTERAANYDPKVGFVLTGPRVVIHARAGGEQPFRNLQAPPEQFGPPKSLYLAAVKTEEERLAQEAERRAKEAAALAEQARLATLAAAQATAVEDAKQAGTAEPGYRIYKSRRRDGLPYLLQRGAWRDAGGKRLFDSVWEKGFAERAQAERHLAWLTQSERDMDHQAESDAAQVGGGGGDDDETSEREHADAEMDYQAA